MKSARMPKKKKKTKDNCPDKPPMCGTVIPVHSDNTKHSRWTEPLTDKTSPTWTCPMCQRATLALIPGSLVSRPLFESKVPVWSPDGVDITMQDLIYDYNPSLTFAAWLKCGDVTCGGTVVVLGTGKSILVDMEEDEDGRPLFSNKMVYQPLFCHPMPDMIEFPKKCPARVTSDLRAAFRLFWSDPSACANHVRASLEHLMDHCKAPRRWKDGNTQHRKLSTRERVERLSGKDGATAGMLLTLKCLRDPARHKKTVTHKELLADFEVLEKVFINLFGPCRNAFATTSAPTSQYSLHKDGNKWRLVFNGESTTLNDSVGIYYVSHLLGNPGKEPIHASTLYEVVPKARSKRGGNPIPPSASEREDEDKPEDRDNLGKTNESLYDRSQPGDRDLALDDREVENRIDKEERDLRAIIENENTSHDQRKKAQTDLEKLKEFRKRHRPRSSGQNDKKVRAVRREIYRFVEGLGKILTKNGQVDPVCQVFADHLEKYLLRESRILWGRLGARGENCESGCFIYRPPEGVTWAD